MRKKVWRSAVARMLEQQHKRRPIPDTLRDRLIALSQKGFTAQECAAQLAQTFAQDHSHKVPPGSTDLKMLCDKIGVTVKYRPLVVEAILQQTDTGFQAIINSTITPSQQRLALAHEIGHLALYQTTGLAQSFGHLPLNERLSSDSAEIEELCDHFAAELVMPSEEWTGFIEVEGLSLSTVKKLSDAYGIDLERAAQRIVDVTTIECVIVLWDTISEGPKVNYLKPRSIWTKKIIPREFFKQRLVRSNETVKPGFPFHTLDTQTKSTGRISLPMRGLAGSYLAQSDVMPLGEIYTLMLPVRLGWETMFRQPPSKQVS